MFGRIMPVCDRQKGVFLWCSSLFKPAHRQPKPASIISSTQPYITQHPTRCNDATIPPHYAANTKFTQHLSGIYLKVGIQVYGPRIIAKITETDEIAILIFLFTIRC